MISGPLLFARYAYPPNELGYCGPDDHRALLEYGAAGEVDGGLLRLEHSFAGAMPYLDLIARSSGKTDPFDAWVVEAYWVGNRLLDSVAPAHLLGGIEDRFGAELGSGRERVRALALAGAPPHHNFHVFGVYPWLGLLRAGWSEEPVRVLDRCRIRWGSVLDVKGNRVVVEASPLLWNGARLGLGGPRKELAFWRRDGYAQVQPQVGDVVSLHWDWVCDRLTGSQAMRLRTITERIISLANSTLDEGVIQRWIPVS